MRLQELLTQLQSHPWLTTETGFRGLALFGLCAALSQTILLPITPFAISAGFLFGFWKSVLLMLAAKMLAASINFALTRSFGRSPAIWLTKRFPFFHHLNYSLEKEGLRLAILMRLCPFPFAIASYGYGLTRLAFRNYLAATFVGILAPSLIFVGVGASARTGIESFNQGNPSKSSWENALFLVGIAASFFVTRHISKIARKKVEESSTQTSEQA
ncbi:MAG: VTT domain-containing protein [Verrucomicrobiota bacterium]